MDRLESDARYHEFPSDDEAPHVVIDPAGSSHMGNLPSVIVPDRSANNWTHVEDLDSFFRRVYEYHQNHGFLCMVLDTSFYLLQCLFTIVFVTFLFSCVDYAVLFGDKPVDGKNSTEHIKVKLKDGIIPPGQCLAGLSSMSRALLVVVLIIWAIRTLKSLFQLRQFLEVKHFYTNALRITPAELNNKTWQDVQRELIRVQREHEMCVHAKELTELDIHHRILRHENYLVALIADNVIPVEFTLPFLGSLAFLSRGYRYNLEAILFWSPWAPFINSWQLKTVYRKCHYNPHSAQREFQNGVLIAAAINLVLTPAIFVWQLLSILFSYADIAKREPGFLGARMWSEYARVRIRHYNELDHELNSRLCRGYQPAVEYMNSFTSHTSVVIAKNVIFFAGSFWVVLVGLTLWDEDFLSVEHIMTSIALLSVILAVCRSAIPDEHKIQTPEVHKLEVLKHIHYKPDDVRNEFSKLFTYKFTHLLSEALSPFLMPFLLLKLYTNSSLIVEYLHNKTATIEAVGDVCTYARLNLEEHGARAWVGASVIGSESLRDHPISAQGEMGKVEMSLIHFKTTNPSWEPESSVNRSFLAEVEYNVSQREFNGPPSGDLYVSTNDPVVPSVYSLGNMSSPIQSESAADRTMNRSIPAHLSPRMALESSQVRMSSSALYLHERRRLTKSSHMSTVSIDSSRNHGQYLPNITEQNESTPLLNFR